MWIPQYHDMAMWPIQSSSSMLYYPRESLTLPRIYAIIINCTFCYVYLIYQLEIRDSTIGGGGGGGLVDTRPLTNLPAMSPCCWPHCEFPSANRKSQGGICEGKGNLRGKEKQHNDKLSFNKAIELELQPLLCWERILRKTDNYHRTTMSCIQEKYAIASKANKLLGYVRD